jgi:hypothetical protein
MENVHLGWQINKSFKYGFYLVFHKTLIEKFIHLFQFIL